MSLWGDFKKFAFKGNVIDTAVGFVMGLAFKDIVDDLVGGVIMPIVSLVLPHGQWQTAAFALRKDPNDPARDVIFQYGTLLYAIMKFFIIAFVLFLLVQKIVKALEGRLSKPEAATTKECPFCLETIPLKATRCKACTSELKVATAS
jgi:large conductance mechanosensitive channel